MDWVKWYHFGVPDQEGKTRENERNHLFEREHCKPCTVISGCYFVKGNTPNLPQHWHCDCKILDLTSFEKDLSAFFDVRKFTEYVFHPDNSKGKYAIFEKWGYHIGDSEALKEEFERQALEKYKSGDYRLRPPRDEYMGMTIMITLHTPSGGTHTFKTGWGVHPLGRIHCSTPFSGEIK